MNWSRVLQRSRHRSPGSQSRSRWHGFSLVEVLIAVMVLALGLLGLGAIFPVVIREQRIGNELTVGVVVGNSARAMLEAVDTGLASGQAQFWLNWRNAHTNIGGLTPHADFKLGQWQPASIVDSATGEMRLGVLQGGQEWRVPLSSRLYPVAEGRGGQPQFVWDVAVQRVWDGNNDQNDDLMRLAVFVRRVDPRIRVPAGLTLYRVLTGTNVATADQRVPVAENNQGVATLDGHGGGANPRYSGIKTLDVTFIYNPDVPAQAYRDRLYYAGTQPVDNSVPWRQVIQPSQKLIDNLGNVYTVIGSGVGVAGRAYVRVTPEVPAQIDEYSTDQIVQVAFTPQIPAAIVTWVVDPRRQP